MTQPHYEDPLEDMFYQSMNSQLKIGQDDKEETSNRLKALDDLQSAYLTHRHTEELSDMTKTTNKVIGKAVDQVKKLTDREG